MIPAYEDSFLLQETLRLARACGCDTILETGTHAGGSTRILAKHFDRVVSIESNPDFHRQAKADMPSNVELRLGSSPAVMREVVGYDQPVVSFLDAHWGDYCPLWDELRVLAEKRIRGPIIIHDFQVPGTDLGFDSYDKPYCMESVAPLLDAVFPDGYDYHYNSTNIDNRGILFVCPRRTSPTFRNDLLPPRNLVDLVGGGDFPSVGLSFFALFQRHGLVTPRSRVLDVGCGCGRIAWPFVDYLQSGVPYDGFDIHREAVEWCQAHYSPAFRFQHADIFNSLYNPGGQKRAASFCFPYPDAEFDLVHLESVFTHMMPGETGNYVREIRRVLKPDGRCVSTFFLLDDNPRPSRQPWTFKEPITDDCYTHTLDNPHAAVGYRAGWVEDLLRPLAIEYGFQDIVIWR